jgi:NitT/TauT family transport system substrate-binding protein
VPHFVNTVTYFEGAVCFPAALASAEQFIKDHRGEAEQIVASQLGSNHTSWKNHIFRLQLDRPLVRAMESEIRWLNSRDATKRRNLPDLLNYVYIDALHSVNPGKVKISH